MLVLKHLSLSSTTSSGGTVPMTTLITSRYFRTERDLPSDYWKSISSLAECCHKHGMFESFLLFTIMPESSTTLATRRWLMNSQKTFIKQTTLGRQNACCPCKFNVRHLESKTEFRIVHWTWKLASVTKITLEKFPLIQSPESMQSESTRK